MDGASDAGLSNTQKDNVISDQNNQGLSSFSCFSELPVEIRLLIWSHALQVPRIVDLKDVRPYRPPDPVREAKEPHPEELFFYGGPPPSMLLVNKEAQKEALKFYTLPLRARGTTKPVTYFNPSYDTLRILDQALRFLEKSDLPFSASMIINTSQWALFEYFHIQYVRACTSLQDLEIIGFGRLSNCFDDNAGPRLDAAFQIESSKYPEWHLPKTKIVHTESGQILAAWEGGPHSRDDDPGKEYMIAQLS